MKRQINRGFTLVEILIVVVILGILAAIVVPQFTTAADDARVGNMDTQVSTIQNQIELFRAKTGAYPTMAELQQAPTLPGTNPDGHFGVLVDANYLKDSPANPFYGGLTEPYDVGPDATTAWTWTAATNTLSYNTN